MPNKPFVKAVRHSGYPSGPPQGTTHLIHIVGLDTNDQEAEEDEEDSLYCSSPWDWTNSSESDLELVSNEPGSDSNDPLSAAVFGQWNDCNIYGQTFPAQCVDKRTTAKRKEVMEGTYPMAWKPPATRSTQNKENTPSNNVPPSAMITWSHSSLHSDWSQNCTESRAQKASSCAYPHSTQSTRPIDVQAPEYDGNREDHIMEDRERAS